MEDFLGMFKQFNKEKAKEGMWEHARNILLNHKYTSIANELGTAVRANIPGLVIGVINTNLHTVVFSKDITYSYIGYIENNNPSIYKNVIKSVYLPFKWNLPIEGVYFYNYKKELIIGWCDGVFNESNVPFLFNLFNPNISLNNEGELTNVNELDKLRWFPLTKEPEYELEYTSTGALAADVIYYTIAYCSDDNGECMWFPPDEVAYVKTGLEESTYRGVTIKLSHLDERYNKFKIGFIVCKDGERFAYKSNIIEYGDTLTAEHTLSTINNYDIISIDELVVPTTIMQKINTMTVQNKRIVIGNYTTSEDINLQKYVNKINLVLRLFGQDEVLEDVHNYPTLMPDEVYAFYIKGKRLDGSYTESFHCPGRKPLNAERNLISNARFTGVPSESNSNLGMEELANKDLKTFHIYNTGGATGQPSDLGFELNWGYWENESEFYPNKDYFDSSDIGGEDLRGTPIRYHRIPGIKELFYLYDQRWANGTEDVKPPHFSIEIENLEEVFPAEILAQFQGFTLEFVKRTRDRALVETNAIAIRNENPPHSVDSLSFVTESAYLRKFTNITPLDDVTFKRSFGISKVFAHDLYRVKPAFAGDYIIKVNYGTDLYRGIQTALKDKYNSIGEATITGILTNITPMRSQIYGYLRSYKYFDDNEIAGRTKYSENQLVMQIHSKLRTVGTVGDVYYPKQSTFIPFWMSLNPDGSGVPDWSYYSVPTAGGGGALIEAGETNPSELDTLIVQIPFNFRFAINLSIIKVTKDVYRGFSSNDLVTFGKVYKRDLKKKLYKGGDVFTNNRINVSTSSYQMEGSSDVHPFLYRDRIYMNGLYQTSNNALLTSKETSVGVSNYNNKYQADNNEVLNLLNTIDFNIDTNDIITGDTSLLNNLVGSSTYDYEQDKYINKFPYRIARSLTIPTESLDTINIRRFLVNSYYDMPNDKGMIIALRGITRGLYIQMQFSLFASMVKDTLETTGEKVYTGEADILDREPVEILANGMAGYIGCHSKFSCNVFRDGLLIIDKIQGKIFLVKDSATEISAQMMRDWFQENLDTDLVNNQYSDVGFLRIDNPYISYGMLSTFDIENERLLITKKAYSLTAEGRNIIKNYDFNGEFYTHKVTGQLLDFNNPINFNNLSETLSFSLEGTCWVCNHDYYPNAYMSSSSGMFVFINNSNLNRNQFIEHNIIGTIPARFYGVTYDSYVDILFNNRPDISKLFQAFYWNTEVWEKAVGVVGDTSIEPKSIVNDYIRNFRRTYDKVCVYTDQQCSGYIDIKDKEFELLRQVEGQWRFNEFRDLVKSDRLPIKGLDGVINEDNIDYNKNFFDKSNFINTFVVIRLLSRSTKIDRIYLNGINIKSIISKR